MQSTHAIPLESSVFLADFILILVISCCLVLMIYITWKWVSLASAKRWIQFAFFGNTYRAGRQRKGYTTVESGENQSFDDETGQSSSSSSVLFDAEQDSDTTHLRSSIVSMEILQYFDVETGRLRQDIIEPSATVLDKIYPTHLLEAGNTTPTWFARIEGKVERIIFRTQRWLEVNDGDEDTTSINFATDRDESNDDLGDQHGEEVRRILLARRDESEDEDADKTDFNGLTYDRGIWLSSVECNSGLEGGS
ncbi:hypothetical protein FQN57_007242 [Myotisia sp. PD_48]|nr:hypothetical protein FQN57_007242 [Myotisia sp. PD_48]